MERTLACNIATLLCDVRVCVRAYATFSYVLLLNLMCERLCGRYCMLQKD